MAYGTLRLNVAFTITPTFLILNQIKPVPPINAYFFKVCFIIFLLSMSRLFPVGLSVKILEEILTSSILTTCSAHLNLIDLIPLTILGELYEL